MSFASFERSDLPETVIEGCGKDHRSDHEQPNSLARALRPLSRRSDDRAGRDDRERRAAVDQGRPRPLRDVARLGRQRLPAHVRRLPAARRPARRPVRPAAHVPDRDLALHGRVARLRDRDLAGAARGVACRAGARRRAGLGGRALPRHDALHRAGRPGEGDGHLRLRPLRRRRRRRAARRRPHRRSQLALDLPRQPAGRRARLRALAAAPAGGSRNGCEAAGSTSRAPSRSRRR